MINYEQNRRKRASHGMASFFSLVKIDKFMRAPYGGLFLEELTVFDAEMVKITIVL